jgi:quercetin dioxygenase-like cupin family protein
MHVIRNADTRRTETPNAVMTTLASPSQGEASQCVWRVEMVPGRSGPLHGIDVEQVWTVLGGGASIEVGPQTVSLGTGDTIVLPAGAARRITADQDAGLHAIVAAPAGMRAYMLSGDVAGPHGPAADADKVLPAWAA